MTTALSPQDKIGLHSQSFIEAADGAREALVRLRAEMATPDADGMVDGVFSHHWTHWQDLRDEAKNARAALDELIRKLEEAL